MRIEMNLPAVAVRTFNTFKSDSGFRKLLKQMSRRLLKLRDPLKRASYIHSKIDEEVEKLFEDKAVKDLVSCKQGCSACCHTQVAVTEDEALLLVNSIDNGLKIDWVKLFVQAKAGNSSKDFFDLPYKMRSCIFQDKEGSCTVYENRPSVCRANFVVSNPELCVVDKGEKSSVKLLNTFGADSWIYSFFTSSRRNGALPYMVKKIVDERKLRPKSKNFTPEL
jgi:Fe-S-cluster containining protein